LHAAHLLSIGDVPEVVVELGAGGADAWRRTEARSVGLYDVALLKKKIKVRYKHAKSQERSQQRKREANNQAALAAESATSAMRVWQQIAIDDRLRAVYRLAAPSYEGHITTTCLGCRESNRDAVCHTRSSAGAFSINLHLKQQGQLVCAFREASADVISDAHPLLPRP
jgi:hypothetical protein